MKNAVVIGVVACASAFCQAAGPSLQLIPQDEARNFLNQQRLKSLNLLKAPSVPGLSTAPAPAPAPPASSVCAIPLLNALPAAGKVDYKIQVIRPPAVKAEGSFVPFGSGSAPFPPCSSKK